MVFLSKISYIHNKFFILLFKYYQTLILHFNERKFKFMNFLTNITDPTKIFTLILFILLTLNFLLNIENEIKISKITGYNRKNFNPLFLLFLGLSFMIILTFYFFDYKSSNFKDAINELLISIIPMLISFGIISYIAKIKKNNTKDVSYFQLDFKQVIFIGIILSVFNPFIGCILRFSNSNLNTNTRSFNFTNKEIFSIFILIFSIAYLSSVTFMKITKPSNSKQKIIFYKDEKIHSLDKPYAVEGYIVSETKNHIIIEINGKISKYNKSDVFSIKEI